MIPKRLGEVLAVAVRPLGVCIEFLRSKSIGSAADVATPAGRVARSALKTASAAVTGAKGSAANSARALTGDRAGVAAEKAASGAKEALGAGKGAVQSAVETAPGLPKAIASGAKAGTSTIGAGAVSAANALHLTVQGALASDLSAIANALVQGAVKGPATIYDRAMDARFIETGIGGGHHRLFDGGHTITGAFGAARGASSEDTIVQESLGAVLGLLRDAGTPRGLPLATWNQDTFNQVAGYLESTFRIPKSWFVDLNSYTGAELLGGAISAVAVVFAWNRADTEGFARLVGGIGVSSALSANPLLMLVTVVAMARAFHKARQTGEMADFVDGQARGGLVAGASFAAISAVSIGGGPVGLALLLAVVTGVLVNAAGGKVSVVQVGNVVQGLAAKLIATARELRDGSPAVASIPVQNAIGLNREFDSTNHRGTIEFQSVEKMRPVTYDHGDLLWP